MTGLGISEFEDSLWDEFFLADYHMVPNDGLECSNDHFSWHESLRNTLCEVNCNSSHSENGSVSRYAHLGRKQGGCSSLHDKCSDMPDTDSWSCKQSDMFPFSSESDLIDETSSVPFDSTRSSCHAFKINSIDSKGGEFPQNETYLGDRRTPVDNQSETTDQESSFNSFENIDSTDFFAGVCPDIQNFEDVEWMFRSPDSTFGAGVDKDELSWLSPGNDEGESEFEFSCPSTDASMSIDTDSSKSYLADDSALESAPIKFKDGSCMLEKSDSGIPFVNIPVIADSKDGFIPRDEIHKLKREFKPLNQLKGIRKKYSSGKGSCRNLSNLPIKVIQLPSAATSHEDPSAHLQQQQKQALGLLNHISNAPLDKSHLPDQTSVNQPLSAVKCKGTDLFFLSQMEFFNKSSQLQSIDCSHDLPSPATSLAGNEKIETQHNDQGNQIHLCGDKFEDPIDADVVSLVNQAKLVSSIVRESSKPSLDDISAEAASFCQLQLVMEWLDFRTRLCIRDGLYRLAQGAKQRCDDANLCGNSGDGKTSSGLLIAEGKNKCTNFTNMEAGTNPIDRSIAHLLFHHPSDSPAILAHDL